MGDRAKIVETEVSGDYGEQVVIYGQPPTGRPKPIQITADGEIKISPVPPDVNTISDKVWDEMVSSHQVGGSTGQAIGTARDSAAGNYALMIHGTYGLSALNTKILANKTLIETADSIVDAIKAKTDNLPDDPADDSEIKAAIAALPNDADIGNLPWEEVMTDHIVVGDTGAYLYDARNYSVLNNDALLSGNFGLNALKTLIEAIPTTAMRGTDNAALASVCLEARLAELDAANLPTDIAALPNDGDIGNLPWEEVMTDHIVVGDTGAYLYDARNYSVLNNDALLSGNFGLNALKTLIETIPTTAMRGTDNAALASVCLEARLAELDAANLPTDIAAIPTTAMRGTDNAATEAKQDTIDSIVDAIKAKTDNLPDDPADDSEIKAAIAAKETYFEQLVPLQLDKKLTITITAADKDFVANNSRAASGLISTDDAKVQKVMMIVTGVVVNTYDGINFIMCIPDTCNQWKMSMDAGAYSDLLPDGQMVTGNWYCRIHGSVTAFCYVFDVTAQVTNINGNIGVRLENATAGQVNMVVTANVYLKILWRL